MIIDKAIEPDGEKMGKKWGILINNFHIKH